MTAIFRIAFLAVVLFSATGSKPLLAQLSMKNPNAHLAPGGALTADEQKRLAAKINNLTPKQRKQLNKAVKKMTPAQQQQFAASLKQQVRAEGKQKR
jgi:hypothetical protein